MPNVLMLPQPSIAQGNRTNSIHNIVLSLQVHLPAFGYELTENASEADLIVGHAGQTYGQGKHLDVACCHGLYPTFEFPDTRWHFEANATVIKNLRSARAVTVPSQWVADILRRDMHLDPTVIGWGIEPDEWTPRESDGYVLWNKTRADRVCDPAPILALAQRFPKVSFMTTFGAGGENVRTIGLQTHEVMRNIIRRAGVYLATTKETFGVGTLEAMASGVPVLGYHWGGTADIVEHGVTGYLVAPGDLDGLEQGLDYCLHYRDVLGANAQDTAAAYTWERSAQQFASLYDRLLAPIGEHPKVSVVIPLHNYAEYVKEALDSVFAQQTTFDYEVLVVENGSTDASRQVARDCLGELHGKLLTFDEGLGPARARNAGIEAAQGDYIVCLDADDRLDSPLFLQRLAETLDGDPALGIAYSGLRLFREVNGQREYRDSGWPGDFNFEAQCAGKNQIPTCCMFRKAAWARAGGYRSAFEPAEDAELFLRIPSLGYGARQVTREPWFHYRWHEQSLSHPVREQRVREPDWRRNQPYALTTHKPFAAVGAPPQHSYPVRNYDRPLVSIIVPVGKGHEQYVQQALDSVEGQTEWRWECLVINDTGAPAALKGQPWAKIIDTPGGKGPGYARNRGLEVARAPLVAFLDADDWLDPHFLELTLRAYALTGRYIYTDWQWSTETGKIERHETPEYEPGLVFFKTSVHSISILVERAALRTVGGFDEHMPAWEDVDLMMKLAKAGLCGQRVGQPLMTYRHHTGTVRERGETVKAELKALLYERYRPYMEGKIMCNCGNTPPVKAGWVDGQNSAVAQAADGMIRILYQGPQGSHDVFGHATRQFYGRRQQGDVFLVWARDQQATPLLFVPLADIGQIIEPTPVPAPPTPTKEATLVGLAAL